MLELYHGYKGELFVTNINDYDVFKNKRIVPGDEICRNDKKLIIVHKNRVCVYDIHEKLLFEIFCKEREINDYSQSVYKTYNKYESESTIIYRISIF